jgi:hypothetical protein
MHNRIARTLQFTLAVLGLFGAMQAHALELYAGASAVQTSFSGMCSGVASNPGFTGGCDDTSTGYKAFGGLQLIPLTAIEVGYIDFGKAKVAGTLSGIPVSRESSANATYAAFVLRGTFDRLTVYGKAGVDYWQASGNLGQTTPGMGQSANGWNYMYGAGLSFRLVGPVGVFGEVERYQAVGDQNTTGKANINAAAIGLVVRF